MTAYHNPDNAGPIVRRPIDFPITASCDTAWNQTGVCSDASNTEMQCLRPLCHSGAPYCFNSTQNFNKTIENTIGLGFQALFDFKYNDI
jgi:hypothetical protein